MKTLVRWLDIVTLRCDFAMVAADRSCCSLRRPSAFRLRLVRVSGLLSLAVFLMAAGINDVPTGFRGTWAPDGKCAAADARLVVTGNAASLGGGPLAPVIFAPHDSPAGEDALHWSGEGEVDNFVLRHDPDVIVHNEQGYGMGSATVFRRCPG